MRRFEMNRCSDVGRVDQNMWSLVFWRSDALTLCLINCLRESSMYMFTYCGPRLIPIIIFSQA
jgi:hypothetical protein